MTMQGKPVQSPEVMPHDKLQAVDLHVAYGLPDGDLECLVALTLVSFFGWHVSSIFSVSLTW